MGKGIRLFFLAVLALGLLVPCAVRAECGTPEDLADRKQAYDYRMRMLNRQGKGEVFDALTAGYWELIKQTSISSRNREWALQRVCDAFDTMAKMADDLLAGGEGVAGRERKFSGNFSPETLAALHARLFSRCGGQAACLDELKLQYETAMADLDERLRQGEIAPASYMEALYGLYGRRLDAMPKRSG
jgi:hypothetical protein